MGKFEILPSPFPPSTVPSMGRRMALRVDRSPRAGSRDAKWLLRSRFQGYLARYQCKLPVMEALRRNRIRNKGIRELAFVGSL